MTWEDLLRERRVAQEPTDREEIGALRVAAARGIADAAIEELSAEGRFERSYDAARSLSTIVVRASGYRLKKPGGHYNTFLALEAADPMAFAAYAAYFNACREIRNEILYPDGQAEVSETELEELLRKVPEFEHLVEQWLSEKYPRLV